MTATIFVDTNVFVYARDTAHAHKHALAVAWLDRIWRDQSGRTSMQVLSELYVTLTGKLRPGISADDAWDDVEALLAWNPIEVDRDLMVRAHEIVARHHLSWWDGMIVAAAQLQDCDALLSEDLQHGMRFGQVIVQSPFLSRVGEAPEGYAAGLEPLPRHRRPGRPRKRA